MIIMRDHREGNCCVCRYNATVKNDGGRVGRNVKYRISLLVASKVETGSKKNVISNYMPRKTQGSEKERLPAHFNIAPSRKLIKSK